MAKKLINLLIETTTESRRLRYLKKIAPVFSVSILVFFFSLYIISLIFVKINIDNYNKTREAIDINEKKIISMKSAEALYIASINVLDKIGRIKSGQAKIIDSTLPVLFSLQSSDSVIKTFSVDNKGPVGLSVETSTLASMEEFVNQLKYLEKEHNFKDLIARGILRENNGIYTFSVNLNAGLNNKINE